MQHSPKCTHFSEVPAWEKSIGQVPHNHELWRYLDSRGPLSVNGSISLPSVCGKTDCGVLQMSREWGSDIMCVVWSHHRGEVLTV